MILRLLFLDPQPLISSKFLKAQEWSCSQAEIRAAPTAQQSLPVQPPLEQRNGQQTLAPAAPAFSQNPWGNYGNLAGFNEGSGNPG